MFDLGVAILEDKMWQKVTQHLLKKLFYTNLNNLLYYSSDQIDCLVLFCCVAKRRQLNAPTIYNSLTLNVTYYFISSADSPILKFFLYINLNLQSEFGIINK